MSVSVVGSKRSGKRSDSVSGASRSGKHRIFSILLLMLVLAVGVRLWGPARLYWLTHQSQERLLTHVQNHPGDSEAVLLLAERYLQADKPGDAEQVLVRLLERDAENPRAWLLRSRAEFEGGKLAPAFGSLQVAMPFLQDNAEAHHRLGLLLERRGDEQAAEAEFRRAVQLDPQHTEAHLRLGQSALAHRHYQPALEHLQTVVRKEPRHSTALEMLSITHRYLGNLDEAERYARASLSTIPGSSRVWLTLGQVLHEKATLESLTEAERAYREALKLEPTLSEAHHQLGKICFDRGEYPEAAAELQRSIDFQPLNRLPYPMLIQCYLRLGQEDRAHKVRREYEKVNEMDLSTAPLEYSIYAMPHNTALRIRLARLYLRYQRPDLARDQVERVLQQNPSHKEALQLAAKLKTASAP